MKDWWQARSTAVKALLVGFAVFVAAGLAGVFDQEEPLPEAGATTTTNGSATTSTLPETTTTAGPTTTTTQPPTTTSTTEVTADAAAVLFILTFEGMRQTIIDIWSDDINVGSVDGFVAEAEEAGDPQSVVVELDVTSGWASPDNQHDGAWEITRAMAVLWHPADGAWYQPSWVPDFRLVNSGRTYECPGELMTALADARSSRAEWEETCA